VVGHLSERGFGSNLIALVVPAAVATDDPKVQATVGFGQWQTDPPLDRFTNPNDRTRNEHVLIPREVKIKAGGAVNFIISGFHEPTIYDDGTQPGDINTSLLEPGSVPPGLIADPNRRIFRGIDPRKQPIWCAPAPSGSGRARSSTVKRAPRCSVALAEAPPGLGRRSPRKDLGMNHLG